jgi:mxaJ protein
MTIQPIWRRSGAVLCCALVLGIARAAEAPADDGKPDVLRVCQDPSNLPFSNTKGEGYENKIAELFAKKLGVKLEYYSFPQRLGFIRNTLKFKLPSDSNYRCDLVMSVPEKFTEVATTRAYYRSTYALVYAAGRGLDGVKTEDDFLKLDPARLKKLRIGVFDRSPASEWLNQVHLVEQGVPYPMMNARPDYYPGEIIDKDLASGKIDVAIAFGPIAGYYARKVPSPRMVVVPLKSRPGVQFDFAFSMGVRYGEPQWKALVERLLEQNRGEIVTILRAYNIPLLNEKGEPLQ